jgi:DNA-binding transcriptional LysR family regulator
VIEQDELVPVVATSERRFAEEVEPADLADRPFIMRERGSATREVVEARLETAGLKPRIAMELGSNAAVAGAVAAGDGIGVLPARSLVAQSRVRRIQVRSVNFSRPFVMLVESGRSLSPAAESFMELCLRKDD